VSPDSTKPFPFFLKGNGFGVAWHANPSSSRRAPKNGVLRALPPFSPRESRRRPSVFATVAVVIAESIKKKVVFGTTDLPTTLGLMVITAAVFFAGTWILYKREEGSGAKSRA